MFSLAHKQRAIIFSLLLLLVTPLLFAEGEEAALVDKIDAAFGVVVGILAKVLFYSIPGLQMPLIVFVLTFGGIYFTFTFIFINIRGFKHSIDVIRGKYDNPDDEGEISHFQALTSALSATVGLGNIAGVAIAVGLGGPGALFWMWLIALFGMCSKFSSCTLAQVYRHVDPETGHVKGGPMYYLRNGLADLGYNPILGKVLAVVFAVLCIFGSLGGANLFQGNQTFAIMSSTFPALEGSGLIVGIIMAVLVALVIIGGIKRIGEVTSKLVPLMCGIYIAICLFILVIHIDKVPGAFQTIFTTAFTGTAISGGFIGTLIQGIRRAVFSNEAGIGSAAIAHAAAKTDEPVREGIVAMIGPFIDTIVVCTMTGLVVVITGVFDKAEYRSEGVNMTKAALSTSYITKSDAVSHTNSLMSEKVSDELRSEWEKQGIKLSADAKVSFHGNGWNITDPQGSNYRIMKSRSITLKDAGFKPTEPLGALTIVKKVTAKDLKKLQEKKLVSVQTVNENNEQRHHVQIKDEKDPEKITDYFVKSQGIENSFWKITIGSKSKGKDKDGKEVETMNDSVYTVGSFTTTTKEKDKDGKEFEKTVKTWDVYENKEMADESGNKTREAAQLSVYVVTISWLPYFLTFAVICFAFSTIISWSYYGEQATEYLFGAKAVIGYKVLYITAVAAGPILKLSNVIDFSDMMLLSMAFPNILGMILLSGKVKEKLDEYWGRYKSGDMKTYM